MTQGFHSFKTPVRIDSFQPHGHFRLVGKTLEIFYPETGKLEMISSVSNWTNSWHTSHIYEDDAAPLVPKGAVLVITGYYDNTRGEQAESRSGSVGRARQPHGGRDVARLDRRDASRRRGLRAAGRRAREPARRRRRRTSSSSASTSARTTRKSLSNVERLFRFRRTRARWRRSARTMLVGASATSSSAPAGRRAAHRRWRRCRRRAAGRAVLRRLVRESRTARSRSRSATPT